jgi:hypothetical protein
MFGFLLVSIFPLQQQAEGASLALNQPSYNVNVGRTTRAIVECAGCQFPNGSFLEITTFNPSVATVFPNSIQIFSDIFSATLTIEGVSLGQTTLQVALYSGFGNLELFVRSNISVLEGQCPVSLTLENDRDGESKLQILRNFRDDVMASSEEGRDYIETFYDHALETSWLLTRYPRIRKQASEILDNLMPVIEAVTENGSPEVLSSDELAEIEDLLHSIYGKASPELQSSIRRLLSDLYLGKFVRIFGIDVEGIP